MSFARRSHVDRTARAACMCGLIRLLSVWPGNHVENCSCLGSACGFPKNPFCFSPRASEMRRANALPGRAAQGQHALEPSCVQACMIRKAREHEVIMVLNMMRENCCGHCTDIPRLQRESTDGIGKHCPANAGSGGIPASPRGAVLRGRGDPNGVWIDPKRGNMKS